MRRAGTRIALAALMTVATVACDGQLTPSDPAPVDAEGLPILAALPQTSGTCVLTHAPAGLTSTASWDASTRTFTHGNLYWKLDERVFTVEYGQTDGQWRHLMTRDEHGVTTAFTYEWQAGQSAENSWDQTNVYDGAGRLTGSGLVYRSGVRRVFYEYFYTDGRLVLVDSLAEQNGTTSRNRTELFWQGEKLVARERGSESAKYGRDTRSYDVSGRLVGIDIDGAGLAPRIDGTPDLRRQWTYDGAGRVASYLEDGTEILDAPVVDGVPDGVTTFEPACAEIAALPLQLYNMMSWLEPR